jgi:hypothetical protein
MSKGDKTSDVLSNSGGQSSTERLSFHHTKWSERLTIIYFTAFIEESLPPTRDTKVRPVTGNEAIHPHGSLALSWNCGQSDAEVLEMKEIMAAVVKSIDDLFPT